MKISPDTSVGEVVKLNFKTASVFQEAGIIIKKWDSPTPQSVWPGFQPDLNDDRRTSAGR